MKTMCTPPLSSRFPLPHPPPRPPAARPSPPRPTHPSFDSSLGRVDAHPAVGVWLRSLAEARQPCEPLVL